MSVQQSPVVLSAANHARQSEAFRTYVTGVPGVKFCQKAGAFKASYVAADGKPSKLGSFDSLDDAVNAITLAYAVAEAV